MKPDRILCGFTIILLGLFVFGNITAQEQKEPRKKSLTEMATEAMEQAAVEAAIPGEYHGLLEQMAGSWTFTGKMWMQPGAPPMELSGTSEFKMIMGGRYLQQDVLSELLGQEFKGLGFIGFNKVVGTFESIWMDNSGTAMLRTFGTGDLEAKVITTFGENKDLRTGKMQKFKTITAIKSRDELRDQSFSIGENGEEILTMELIYKRK